MRRIFKYIFLNSMDILPVNILFQIFKFLPVEEIIISCSKNKHLTETILQNEDFWQEKYLQDYGVPNGVVVTWRETYHQVKNAQILHSTIGQNISQKQIHLPDNVCIKSISSRYRHSLILTQNGQVYAFGENGYGELGLGDKKDRDIPTLIPLPKNVSKIKDIFTGPYKSFLIDDHRQVYSFGNNVYGELGFNDSDEIHVPTLITFFSSIKNSKNSDSKVKIQEISSGQNHTLFLSEDGRVYSCGNDNCGQLGLRGMYTRECPLQIPLPEDVQIKTIATGNNHSFLVDKQGQVYGFGNNFCGQLGIKFGAYFNYTNIPTLIPVCSVQIQNISAGYEHSLFLTEGGQVFGCGHNNHGQLGLTNNRYTTPTMIKSLYRITSLSAGHDHSLFLKYDGSVYVCGKNEDQPVLIPDIHNAEMISAGSNQSLILTRPLILPSTLQILIDQYRIKDYLKYENGLINYWDREGNRHLSDIYYDEDSIYGPMDS